MSIKRLLYTVLFALAILPPAQAQNNIAEEVAWVIGDTPIWKSEIEEQLRSLMYERRRPEGDPYCYIPEQMAVQKLFLHQADIDTVEVNETMIVAQADAQMNYLLTQLGSRDKIEQYFHKSYPELRLQYIEMMRNEARADEVRRSLTSDIKVTPADVRRFYDSLSQDSIPYVMPQVEVQIITMHPEIPRQEIEDIKNRLRSYSEGVTSGKDQFSTLAIMYSEDRESAMRGGETGMMNRVDLDPEFASVAFNLNDPKRVSRIVESEFGYHIIQLIEKRGDRINVRHILLTPRVSDNERQKTLARMDSVRNDIIDGKFTFELAATYISQDKDTRANRGQMVNHRQDESVTSQFFMSELPQEVAKIVDGMNPGDISQPFTMINQNGKEAVAIVKLTSRTPGHKADLRHDYQQISNMYRNAKAEQILTDWLSKKIRETYVRIEPAYRNCQFQYAGWIKESDAE